MHERCRGRMAVFFIVWTIARTFSMTIFAMVDDYGDDDVDVF